MQRCEAVKESADFFDEEEYVRLADVHLCVCGVQRNQLCHDVVELGAFHLSRRRLE
jgi:hypothetical protein